MKVYKHRLLLGVYWIKANNSWFVFNPLNEEPLVHTEEAYSIGKRVYALSRPLRLRMEDALTLHMLLN